MAEKNYISNLGDVTKGIEAWVKKSQNRVKDATRDAVKETADAILVTAKELVPVATGTLRDSLHVSLKGTYATVRTDAKKAPHGHLIEFGTVKSAAQPFLYPAAEQHQKNLPALIKGKLAEGGDDGD